MRISDWSSDVCSADLHVAEPRLPKAVAVVNPTRLDDDSPHGQIAAVGVAFLLAVAVNRALRQAGRYGQARPDPGPPQWLSLVAHRPGRDVVVPAGPNRPFVAPGLPAQHGKPTCSER